MHYTYRVEILENYTAKLQYYHLSKEKKAPVSNHPGSHIESETSSSHVCLSTAYSKCALNRL